MTSQTMEKATSLRVYIAGPYTNGDPALNVRRAITAAEEVVAAGHVPFVPHLDHLWHLVNPHDYEYWLRLDLAWLEACDCVIRLDGDSPGADLELQAATQKGKAIYSLEEFLGLH